MRLEGRKGEQADEEVTVVIWLGFWGEGGEGRGRGEGRDEEGEQVVQTAVKVTVTQHMRHDKESRGGLRASSTA
jgi:hypothetical protein